MKQKPSAKEVAATLKLASSFTSWVIDVGRAIKSDSDANYAAAKRHAADMVDAIVTLASEE